MLDWLGMPTAASAHAADIDEIMVLVHWLIVVLFAGWGLFFLYVLIRFRRAASPIASYEGTRSRWPTIVEGGVLVAEVVLLVGFSIPVWTARVAALPSEPQSTVVRIVAEQFAWNVHYPGPDGVFGRTDMRLLGSTNPLGLDRRSDPAARDDVTTINQLNFPVGRPVIVHLSSKDVVHSFTLPQMRVKQDAIPGIAQTLWFTPSEIGEWEIACSQLCGLGHYRMKGFYAVQTESAFATWLAEQAAR